MRHLILFLISLTLFSQSTDTQVQDLIVMPRLEMTEKKLPRVTIHHQTRQKGWTYRLTSTIDIEGRKKLEGKIEVMQWVVVYIKNRKGYLVAAERITRFERIEDAVQLPTLHAEENGKWTGSATVVAVNRRIIAVKHSHALKNMVKFLPYMRKKGDWLLKNPYRLEAKQQHLRDRE